MNILGKQISRFTLLAFAVAFTSSPLQAQEAKTVLNPPSAEARIKLTKPGLEHEKLARYVGAWEVEIRMGSGNAAMVYQGAADNRMLVGGRFLEMAYLAKGKTGDTEGIFQIGFDSRHQSFALIAMDSFGNYFVTSRGKLDEKSGKIRMLGTDDDPAMKAMGHTKEFVHILDLRGPDEYVVEIWFIDTRTDARREFKFMDYTFKRKK